MKKRKHRQPQGKSSLARLDHDQIVTGASTGNVRIPFGQTSSIAKPKSKARKWSNDGAKDYVRETKAALQFEAELRSKANTDPSLRFLDVNGDHRKPSRESRCMWHRTPKKVGKRT